MTTVAARGRSPLDIAGKTVLITGASGGIGEAMAEGFAGAGAALALHYRANGEKVDALKERIVAEHAGTPVIAFKADLSEAAQAEAMIDRVIREFGRIDVLVNCVGQAYDNALFLLTEEDVEKSLHGNFSPVVHSCKYSAASMIRQGSGRIINVASITGLVGQPMRTLYAAAKGAVIAFTKSIARELAPHGVTANVLVPQVVDSGIADAMKDRIRDLMRANTPLQRDCKAEDIVGAALFLSSSAADYITGEPVNITGGLITW